MSSKNTFDILKYHSDIINILDRYILDNKIPNIIFHGENGSGKKTILKHFLNKIYKGVNKKEYIMNVNCVHNKGIQFIRNELKFFAKTHMNENKNNYIKSIILLNAEYLTMDAQSALRRSIELFSKNTRFFIVIENKEKLLKPIISRFCDIYISRPIIGSKELNLHNLKHLYQPNTVYNTKNKNMKNMYLKLNELYISICDHPNNKNELYRKFQMFDFINSIYEKGIHCNEFVQYIINHETDTKNRLFNITLLCYYDKIKSEYYNEKLLLFHIINKYIMRNEYHLENIDTL